MTSGQSRFDADVMNAEVRSQSGWFVVCGVALFVLAVLCVRPPGRSHSVTSVLFWGVMMTIGVAIQIV